MFLKIRSDNINEVTVCDNKTGYAVAQFYYQSGMDGKLIYEAKKYADQFISLINRQMNNTLPPGEITRGLTEYIFSCWVCNRREVIHAHNKPEAITLAKESGWFKKHGKWYCCYHKK
jgi:hypothetical protein